MSTIKVTQIYPRSVDLYTVSQNKRHPVYSCGNFVRCHLISLIFVRSITGRIRNEKAYLQPTTWFNKSELNLVILARPSHHRTALATPWLSDPRGTVDLWHRTVQAWIRCRSDSIACGFPILDAADLKWRVIAAYSSLHWQADWPIIIIINIIILSGVDGCAPVWQLKATFRAVLFRFRYSKLSYFTALVLILLDSCLMLTLLRRPNARHALQIVAVFFCKFPRACFCPKLVKSCNFWQIYHKYRKMSFSLRHRVAPFETHYRVRLHQMIKPWPIVFNL